MKVFCPLSQPTSLSETPSSTWTFVPFHVVGTSLFCSALNPTSKFWFIRKSLCDFFFPSRERMAFVNKGAYFKITILLSMWQILFESSKSNYDSLVRLSFPRSNGCYWFNEMEEPRIQVGTWENKSDTSDTMCLSSPNMYIIFNINIFRRIHFCEVIFNLNHL